MTLPPIKKVLINGASIAGPTAAFWLKQAGMDVTVVERADAIRSGGYAIDIRGTAIGVVEQMGILPQLKAAHLHSRLITFFDSRGRRVGSIRPEVLMGADDGHDVELPRGTLTELLFELTRNMVEYRFNDHVTSLTDQPDGVHVEFKSGLKERYDLVIGADGLHSRTREMVFGPEEQFRRYLGYTFTLATMKNTFGLNNEAVVFNKPGRGTFIYAGKNTPFVYVFFVMKRPVPSREDLTTENIKATLNETFRNDGWLLPQMLKGLENATDIYSDSMMQIKMPRWSSGRVVLTGDSAHGPSFFSGQGTSTALVGAYTLAGTLAAEADYREALKKYESTARAFIEENQAVASEGAATLAPDTAMKVRLRNTMIRLAPILSKLGLISATATKAYTAMELPEYSFRRPTESPIIS